jgi:hypothetical protein
MFLVTSYGKRATTAFYFIGTAVCVPLASLAIVVVLETVIILESRLVSARTSYDASPSFAPTPLDRTLKGDRLQPRRVGPLSPAALEPPLPKECELHFSERNIYLTEVAGRCVV